MKFRIAIVLALCPASASAQALLDDHVHLHDGERSLAAYEAQLRKDGLTVERFGAMWFGGPNQAKAGDPAAIRAGNDGIIALAARHPRLLPIGTVHPYDGEAALTEIDRIAAKGIRILKIHAHTQGFDVADPRVLAVAKRAGARGLTVLSDNAGVLPGDSEKLFNLALAAPKTTFIFAHLGGMSFRFWNILKAARTAEGLFGENIWFDVSATVDLVAGSPIADEFVWTIRNVGVDHVLLGSDYPQYSLKQNFDALEKLPLTPAEKAKIRAGNMRRLLAQKD